MTYRTTEAVDRDIADLYADSEAQFGTRHAKRGTALFDLFNLLAVNRRLALKSYKVYVAAVHLSLFHAPHHIHA